MRLDELEDKRSTRAGLIPYAFKENGLNVYLMIPSDANYGGKEPQIAKGRIDPGEDAKTAALREASEELGLKLDNVTDVEFLIKDTITGLDETYVMSVFSAKVINPDDFNTPDFETGWAGWIPINEALAIGRNTQRKYLEIIDKKIGEQL